MTLLIFQSKRIAKYILCHLPDFFLPVLKARALMACSKDTMAVTLLQKVIQKHPRNLKANMLLVRCYEKLAKFEVAIALCIQIQNAFPDNLNVQYCHARCLLYTEHIEESVALFRLCMKKSPLSMELMHDAALAEFFCGNEEEGIAIVRSMAIQGWPVLAEAYKLALSFAPRHAYVQELFDTVINFVVDADQLLSTLFYVQSLELRQGDALLWRMWYAKAALHLSQKNISLHNLEKCYAALILPTLFNHDHNDISLRNDVAKIFMQSTHGLVYESPLLKMPTHVEINAKIRLGFAITRYNTQEFSTAIENLLNRFDQNKFEFVLFRQNDMPDNENRRRIDSLALSTATYYHSDWRGLRKVVERAAPDIILHENITNISLIYLPFARLAPIQCNVIDRQTTVGVPYQDYLIIFGNPSNLSEWAQTENGKLVILKNNYWVPSYVKCQPEPVTKRTLGLSDDAQIIFFPQTLHRWLAEDDIIIAEVLRRHPKAYFFAIAFYGNDGFYIRHRWKMFMPDLVPRIKILSWPQPLDRFLGILALADAVFSPMRNKGSNSLGACFELGQPTVMGKGQYFSGQFGTYLYEIMDVEGLVAQNHAEYIEIADKLLNNPAWRAEKQNEVRNNYHKAFNIDAAAVELQDFLLDSHKRYHSGLPPAHWLHGSFVKE